MKTNTRALGVYVPDVVTTIYWATVLRPRKIKWQKTAVDVKTGVNVISVAVHAFDRRNGVSGSERGGDVAAAGMLEGCKEKLSDRMICRNKAVYCALFFHEIYDESVTCRWKDKLGDGYPILRLVLGVSSSTWPDPITYTHTIHHRIFANKEQPTHVLSVRHTWNREIFLRTRTCCQRWLNKFTFVADNEIVNYTIPLFTMLYMCSQNKNLPVFGELFYKQKYQIKVTDIVNECTCGTRALLRTSKKRLPFNPREQKRKYELQNHSSGDGMQCASPNGASDTKIVYSFYT